MGSNAKSMEAAAFFKTDEAEVSEKSPVSKSEKSVRGKNQKQRSFFQRVRSSISDGIGLDLGSRTTVLYLPSTDEIICEPSVLALRGDTILAVGSEAKAMLGKTPGDIQAFYPLRGGVVADFEYCKEMVKSFLGRARRFSVGAPQACISIPASVTEVEARAFQEAVIQAGVSKVTLVDQSLAAAVGAGLDVMSPTGRFLVTVGGDTAQAAVISLGEVVHSRISSTAGNEIDRTIIEFFKENYQFLIGDQMAEEIKITVGTCRAADAGALQMKVYGRDETGLPRGIEIDGEEICQAIAPRVDEIVANVVSVLKETPPELAGDVVRHGVYLAGGGALLRGLDKRLEEETQLKVTVVDDPISVVARGAFQHGQAHRAG